MTKLMKNKKLSLIITLLFVLLLSLGTATYAWLAGSGTVSCELIRGSILTQYFHCGTGTSSDPFVITRPVHFYNLIYLYQRRPDGFANKNYYFQLGYDLNNDGNLEFYKYNDDGTIVEGEYETSLNMEGFRDGKLGALLPVGTATTPFKGTFNGSDLTVRNVHVHAYEQIVTPEGATETYGTCDVGIFGFVTGTWNGSSYTGGYIHDVNFEDVTIDISGLSTAYTSVSGHTTHTDGASGSESQTVHMGYLVGHLDIYDTDEHGTMNTLNICNDVYVQNCTVTGTCSNVNVTSCQYGYFGYIGICSGSGASVTPISIDEQIKEAMLSESSGNNGSGYVPGWGGSLHLDKVYSATSTAQNDGLLSSNQTYGRTVDRTYTQSTQSVTDNATSTASYKSYIEDDANFAGKYFYYSNVSITNIVTDLLYLTAGEQTLYRTLVLNQTDSTFYIKNGSYYLTYNASTNTKVSSTTSGSTKFYWVGDYLCTVPADGFTYALCYNGTDLYFKKVDRLASGFNWNNNSWKTASTSLDWSGVTAWNHADSTKIYIQTTGETKQYLYCNSGVWAVLGTSTIYVRDANGHYLTVSGSSLAMTTTQSAALAWTKDGNTLKCVTSFATYYLYGGTYSIWLSTDGSAATQWYFDSSNNLYCVASGTNYYLVYDSHIGTWWVRDNDTSKVHYRIVAPNRGLYMKQSDAVRDGLGYWRIPDTSTPAYDAAIFQRSSSSSSFNLINRLTGKYLFNRAGNTRYESSSAGNPTTWKQTNGNKVSNVLYTTYGISNYYLFSDEDHADDFRNDADAKDWNNAATLENTAAARDICAITYAPYTTSNVDTTRESSGNQARTEKTTEYVFLEDMCTYLPLIKKITDDEDENYTGDDNLPSDNSASSRNTGYIIGGSYDTSEQHSDIQISRTQIGSAFTNSLGSFGLISSYYEDSRFEILTAVRQEGTLVFKRIKDPYHNSSDNMTYMTSAMKGYTADTAANLGLINYISYENSEAKLSRDYLEDYLSLTQFSFQVYGVHLLNTPISMDRIVTVKNVRLYGANPSQPTTTMEFSTFEFPASSIDFFVGMEGCVSLFAGTYLSGNDSFFSLNQVFRDSSYHITDIKEVRYIMTQSITVNHKAATQYCYIFSDGTMMTWLNNVQSSLITTYQNNVQGAYSAMKTAGYSLAFDMNWMMNPVAASGKSLVSNACYYFEIPVHPGEYCLGSVEGKTGAYLFYLDIGTNGNYATVASETPDMPAALVSSYPLFKNIDYDYERPTAREYTDAVTSSAYNGTQVINSLFNFTYSPPEGATASNFSISVKYIEKGEAEFDNRADAQTDSFGNAYTDAEPWWCQGIYKIYVKNLTGNSFDITTLLSDNDTDGENVYPYAFEFWVYNPDSTATEEQDKYEAISLATSVSTYQGTLSRWSRTYSFDVTNNTFAPKS